MVNAKAQIQGKTERKGKEGEAHREELLQIHDEEDVNHGGSRPIIPLVCGLAVVHLPGRRPLRRRGGRLRARGGDQRRGQAALAAPSGPSLAGSLTTWRATEAASPASPEIGRAHV